MFRNLRLQPGSGSVSESESFLDSPLLLQFDSPAVSFQPLMAKSQGLPSIPIPTPTSVLRESFRAGHGCGLTGPTHWPPHHSESRAAVYRRVAILVQTVDRHHPDGSATLRAPAGS